jgi:hypothetical protein
VAERAGVFAVLSALNPTIKRQWQALRRSKPGCRFQARYEAGQKAKKEADWGFNVRRIFGLLVALGAVAIGVVLVFIPGPAIPFLFVAGGLLASESIVVARFLDRTEVRVRSVWAWLKCRWHKLRLAGKIAVTGLGMAGASGCAYAAYRLMAG